MKDLVFQFQDQFFEADRVRVQHRSGKPMDEVPEIMETDLVAGSTSPGPKCGESDAGEVVQEDDMSEVVASEKDLKCERSKVVACEIFDSVDAVAVFLMVDEQFAPRGNPACTERVTERFIEASGAAGKNDWLGAWSEVVDAGDAGETERIMLVFDTRSCNAGTASALGRMRIVDLRRFKSASRWYV